MSDDNKQEAGKSLGWLMIRAARAHRNRLGARLAAHNLVAGQEQVLQSLADAGPMNMGELATMLGVRPPTVSKAVTRLEALGLIKRLPGRKNDSRIVRVNLTTAGKSKAQQVDALWLETEADIIADFDAKDQKRLRKLLRRIIRNLSGPEDISKNHEALDNSENRA